MAAHAVDPTSISPRLKAFIDEAPLIRGPHVELLRTVGALLSPAADVLDVGAGEAPYRELFEHTNYLTTDWMESIYPEAEGADIRAPADSLPVSDASFDAIVNTQVLEHVSEPSLVLKEFHRVLRSRGRLVLTTPMVWYLHETPHDYYRYTSYGLRYLLEKAGFVEIEIKPMNNSFETIAQLVFHLAYMAGRSDDGFDLQRNLITSTMDSVATLVESFGQLDTQWILPLSFSATATRGEMVPDTVVASDLEIARAEVTRLLKEVSYYRSALTNAKAAAAGG